MIEQNMIAVFQRDLSALTKELRDTQRELSQVLSEFQATISSLAAITSAGLGGLDARISDIERVLLVEATPVEEETP